MGRQEMCKMGMGESGRCGREGRTEGGNVGRYNSILEAFVKWYENLVKGIHPKISEDDPNEFYK